MRLAERHFDTTVQSKRECDSNVASAEDDSVVLKPWYVVVGGLPVVYPEGPHNALCLLFECREFADALIFPIEYFRLFVKFSADALGDKQQ